MKIYLAVTMVGPFLLEENGNVIGAQYFETNPTKVSQKINQLNHGILIQEIKDILKEHKKDEIFVQKPSLGRLLSEEKFKVISSYENPIIDQFHKNIVSYLLSTGIFSSKEDYRKYLYETSIMITRERVKLAAEKRDRLVVHAIETIDDIDKTLNLFSGRLREFYGMHFPELVDAIENHYTFAIIVSKSGDKSNIAKKLLVEDLNIPESKAQQLLDAREKSMGSTLLDQDIKIIQDQAQIVVDLYERRQSLEKWMEETMTVIAPNICGVTSALIGARLIALAGSLKDLALCPSSKLQVLGAEKALYRTIKTGAPPPKHGIIFQDPRLNQAKWWQRGKIARVISGKLSIAARMDYFEAESNATELAKEVNAKINEIIQKYPEPSEKAKQTPQLQKRPPPSSYKSRGGKPPGKKSGSNYQKRR
ncbi:MAG: hypothetical protein ACFFDW_16145 [Candidatus Thorarchaeota archaeon]